MMQEMADMGTVDGVDIADEAVQYCRQRGVEHVTQASVIELPFPVDANTMLQGAPGAADLLCQYGVGYVVIGPGAMKDAGANLSYYRTNYPLAYMSPIGEYQIFKVS
jgi:hypothetical protein